MKDIQEKIKSVLGCAIALILTLIVSSIIYLGCNEGDGAIINSLSLIRNYIGAITTLTAAYIASLLFNDWRDQVKDKRKEYFILKYLEYLDYMHQLLFNLTFHHKDFEDKALFQAKIANFLNNLSTQPLEAGSRLKAIIQDKELDILIDKEAKDRGILMMKYLEDIKSASSEQNTQPNAIKDTLELYSGEKSLPRVYRDSISKEVSGYCLKQLISFD